MAVDFFTPPALYVLGAPLELPPAAEQFLRVVTEKDLPGLPQGCVAMLRSARSREAVQNGWEFDNAPYIATAFSG